MMSEKCLYWALLGIVFVLFLLTVFAAWCFLDSDKGYVGIMAGAFFGGIFNLFVILLSLSIKENYNISAETKFLRQRINAIRGFVRRAINKDEEFKISCSDTKDPSVHAMKRIVDHLDFAERLGHGALDRNLRSDAHEIAMQELTQSIQCVSAVLTYMRDEKWLEFNDDGQEHVRKSLRYRLCEAVKHLDKAEGSLG